MADQPSIFGNQNSNGSPDPTNQPTSGNGGDAHPSRELEDLLGSIKNERGEPKYKSVQDALVALKHSQEYIPTIKGSLEEKDRQLAEATAALQRMQELERTLQELTQNKNTPADKPGTSVAPEQIAELVERVLTNKTVEKTRQENLEKVISATQAAFGQEAETRFYGRAKELGLTPQQVNDLAATSPTAALELLGIKPKVPGVTQPSVVKTAINTEGFQPRNETLVKRNEQALPVGATFDLIADESRRSKAMVEELHAQGLSVHDLTDPKVYKKFFG